MKVVTLPEEVFERHAGVLARAILTDCRSGFDLVVGIRRGGAFMADALLKCLPADYCTIRRDVTLQRDSTKRKSGIVEKILRILPYPLLDWMRMAESVLLSSANKEATPRLWTPTDSDRLPSRSMVERILVVDDAIDSGATLAGVVAGLKKEYPGADIKTAVMTVTTTNPMIFPDWTLFAGDTLLRFPWSADFKKKK